MAKYKPRKDGKFLTHVTVPGKKNDDGSSVRVNVWADSSRELETKIGEVKSQLKVGTYADDCGLSFGDYSKKWLSTYKENVVSTKTFFKYRTIVNSHFEILNTIRLRDIGKSDIQSQLNKYPNSYDTRRMILLTARQILDCAIDDGLLYRNVALKVTVKKPIGSKSNRRPLNENEKAAIRQLIDSGMFTSMERFYINTLLCTGCRPSEALALCRSDFDLKANVVHVNKSLSWAGGKSIKSPKTNSSIRDINFPSWFVREASEYLKTIPGLYAFYSNSGILMSECAYSRFWRKIYNKINSYLGGTPNIYKNGKVITYGIKATDLTAYIFRHNYATMLYYGGFDVKEASRLMGHSDIKITLEIYTHLASQQSSMDEKLSRIVL